MHANGTAPVALVHGWAFGPSVWNGLLPALSARTRVTRWALRGYGGADAMLDGDAWPATAPVTAIGWSLGGMLLAEAAREPGRVRALVLVGVNAKFLADDSWPDATAPAAFESLRAVVAEDRAAALRRFATLCARGQHARSTARTLLGDAVGAASTEVLLEGLRALRAFDLCETLRTLSIPVCWVVGDEDPLVPVAAGEAIRRLNPAIALRVIRGAGHAPFLSHRDAFLDAIGPFIA